MKITTEAQILEPAFRAKLIQEIEGAENKARKYDAYKRYQCYKDGTKHYVVSLLMRQFERQTVEEMRYALSNISIIKKVIDKLARVYSNGVVREISGDEVATAKLKKIEKVLKLNDKLKTTNRFLKLHKNTTIFIKPYPLSDDANKYALCLDVLQPFLYDVCEYDKERTHAVAYIHSDYRHPATDLADLDINSLKISGNNIDETIANVPNDQAILGNKKYTFWSKNYHFVTDQSGAIIEKLSPNNPLKSCNHVNFSIDQDGNFWAIGGDDLIDGAIMINSVITHTQHVGISQGYGQFFMSGENLPRTLKVGVNKAIIAEYKKDEQAKPEAEFLSANPELEALRGLIEMYIALYLTTNNLSTSGVSTQLGNSSSMASGIALLLDKAESLEDVQDQRQVFIDNEVKIMKAINETLKAFNAQLSDEFKDLILPEGFEANYIVKFNDAQAIQTEKEKLDTMKLRRDMGLDTRLAMLMRDDASLSEEQAEQKLLKMIEQEIKEKQLEIEAAKAAGLDNVVDVEGEDGDAVDPNADPKLNDLNKDENN